jgi:hypothetical protein
MAAMTGAALVVPARFNGPPGSANGGYFAGRLATCLLAIWGGGVPAAAVTVTLRKPPPLEEPMDLVRAEGPGTLAAKIGNVLIAEAGLFSNGFDEVEPVTFEEARKAARYYGGLIEHPFPTCFSCGLTRPGSDGLGLRPGLLPDREGVTAAAWRPDGSLTDPAGQVRPEFVWAALDCPGGWTVDVVGRPMVLGRMSAQVLATPGVSEPCVVMGRLDGRQGRQAFTSTTAYGTAGRVLGHARAVWIEIPEP